MNRVATLRAAYLTSQPSSQVQRSSPAPSSLYPSYSYSTVQALPPIVSFLSLADVTLSRAFHLGGALGMQGGKKGDNFFPPRCATTLPAITD